MSLKNLDAENFNSNLSKLNPSMYVIIHYDLESSCGLSNPPVSFCVLYLGL